MAAKHEIYKCMACGNIVEVVHGGDGELVCCGQPMKKIVENTVDAAKEKHVPVIEKLENGYKSKSAAWRTRPKNTTSNGLSWRQTAGHKQYLAGQVPEAVSVSSWEGQGTRILQSARPVET